MLHAFDWHLTQVRCSSKSLKIVENNQLAIYSKELNFITLLLFIIIRSIAQCLLFLPNSLTWFLTVAIQQLTLHAFCLLYRQTEEMEEKVRLLNTSTTEEEINALAAAHFEAQSVVAGRWGSQLDALAQAQRAHHRRWLMDTLEEYQTTSALNTPR